MEITIEDFKKLKKTGKEKQRFQLILLNFGAVSEYKFHEKRKWRFDFALPEIKVAFEYEGIYSEKSRHTTLKGFKGDCEKYNEAALAGWRVLRYAAGTVKNLGNDLKRL